MSTIILVYYLYEYLPKTYQSKQYNIIYRNYITECLIFKIIISFIVSFIRAYCNDTYCLDQAFVFSFKLVYIYFICIQCSSLTYNIIMAKEVSYIK